MGTGNFERIRPHSFNVSKKPHLPVADGGSTGKTFYRVRVGPFADMERIWSGYRADIRRICFGEALSAHS